MTRKHQRHGTQCVIQYPTNGNPAQSLQVNSITVFGRRLYNSLPKCLRDIGSVKTEKFKFELDKFLELIPDEQKMPNYVTASGSSGILNQLTHLRSQGIYQSGGVPYSAVAALKPLQVSKYQSAKKKVMKSTGSGEQFHFRLRFVWVVLEEALNAKMSGMTVDAARQ